MTSEVIRNAFKTLQNYSIIQHCLLGHEWQDLVIYTIERIQHLHVFFSFSRLCNIFHSTIREN